ncbi:putative toxin-antitoxin system toxin component, PIN family, partial [Patescibacteria group bacterium]|nr:putative toxin-antitoxin system toxin component, PIN family [Patescibacteria group bacterium]
LFGGSPEKILTCWMRNEFILCISPQLQAEIVNKLRNKFKVSQKFINTLLIDLNEHTKKFIPQAKISLARDPKDNFLLELAEEAKANFLITGDKDLLTIKKYNQTKIVSSTEYLNRQA